MAEHATIVRQRLEGQGAEVTDIGQEGDPHFAVNGLTLHFSELETFREETGWDVSGFDETGTVFLMP